MKDKKLNFNTNMELCIACLAFDVKLYRMEANTYLNSCYEQLSGLKVQSYSYSGYICYQCFPLFYKFMKLKEKCNQAALLLSRIWQDNSEIRQQILLSEHKLSFNSHLNITKNPNIDIMPTATIEREEMLPHTNSIYLDQSEKSILDKQFINSNIIVMNESVTVENEMKKDNISYQSDHSDNSISNKQLVHLATTKKFKIKKKSKNNCVLTRKKSAFNGEFATEIILSLEEQEMELKARVFSLNYINCPMRCEFCFKGFLDSDAFKNHMAKHDKNAGTFVCSVCSLRYADVRRLREHTATAHSRRFRCNRCGHLSHTTEQARVHENWHRGVTFQCQLCGETFAKPTTHLNHMRKKHPTNNVCNICGLSFIGKHGLMMHKKKIHANNEARPISDKTIDEEPENIDKQNGDRYCEDCDISFVTKFALTRHIMSSPKHALESKCGNVCRICSASFLTRTSLTRHSRTHAPLTPRARMPCDECHATFASGAGVRAHRARAHGELDEASKQRCYVCDVCGKTCRSNAVLQYHLRVHTGERPYQCRDCPKRFPDKTQLSLHARTHSGDRPYACSKCSAKFKQKGALNRHIRIHTGEKPHHCNMCHKTFSRMGTLKNHVVSVHLTKLNSDQVRK